MTEFIEYPDRPATVAGLKRLRLEEDVLEIDVIDLGRTLRVVRSTPDPLADEVDTPFEPYEAPQTPAPEPVAPVPTPAPAEPQGSVPAPEDEDLVGTAPSSAEEDFTEQEIFETVRDSSAAEIEILIAQGTLTKEQVKTAETAEGGKNRDNVRRLYED